MLLANWNECLTQTSPSTKSAADEEGRGGEGRGWRGRAGRRVKKSNEIVNDASRRRSRANVCGPTEASSGTRRQETPGRQPARRRPTASIFKPLLQGCRRRLSDTLPSDDWRRYRIDARKKRENTARFRGQSRILVPQFQPQVANLFITWSDAHTYSREAPRDRPSDNWACNRTAPQGLLLQLLLSPGGWKMPHAGDKIDRLVTWRTNSFASIIVSSRPS
jgi:hypothetical protein